MEMKREGILREPVAPPPIFLKEVPEPLSGAFLQEKNPGSNLGTVKSILQNLNVIVCLSL